MSWSGFKKAVNRATTQVMQSTGIVEKTVCIFKPPHWKAPTLKGPTQSTYLIRSHLAKVDKDFDEAERSVKNLHAKFERLHKDSKALQDAYKSLSISHTRLAATFSPPSSSPSLSRGPRPSTSSDSARSSTSEYLGAGGVVAARYAEAVREINDLVDGEVNPTLSFTHLTPLLRLTLLVPTLDPHLEKRRKRLLDHDAQRARVRRAVEKAEAAASKEANRAERNRGDRDLDRDDEQVVDGENVRQLKQDMERLWLEYDKVTTALMLDVGKMVDARTAYLDPVAEAGVRIGESRVSSASSSITSLATADDSMRAEAVLEHKMKELSICGAGA
ncbi:hypothetical protein HDU93_003026 [Gonapodya sp. JEL0774]|nr:hypothetical protein HDU93_003026 [Gonapodya sp. JEL0774]